MKIVSWNVNGLRAIAKKTFFTDLELLGPDILCLQEIKAQEHHMAETLEPLNGYHIFSNSANKTGLLRNCSYLKNQAPECDKRDEYTGP